MTLRNIQGLVALAGLSAATSGCGLVAGFESIATAEGSGGGGTSTYQCVWQQVAYGNDVQAVNSITIDAKGNVWVAGSYQNHSEGPENFTFGGHQLDSEEVAYDNAFIVALSNDQGTYQFGNKYGAAGDQSATAMALTSTGVFVTGTNEKGKDTQGTISLCGTDETTMTRDVFMVELGPDGSCRSAAALANSSYPTSAVVGTNMVLAATDSDNGVNPAHLFLRNYGSTLTGQEPQELKLEQDRDARVTLYGSATLGNRFFLAGEFTVSAKLGGDKLSGDSAGDAFVSAYDLSGPSAPPSASWSYDYGASGEQSARAIASNGKDTLFIAGRFANEIDFKSGGPPLYATGPSDVFVAAIAANDGAGLWHVGFDGSGPAPDGPNLVTPIAYDAKDDAVIVSGSYSGSLTIGDYHLENKEAGVHGFLARIDAKSGAVRFAMNIGTNTKLNIRAMALYNGSVFIGGQLDGAPALACPGQAPPSTFGNRAYVARLDPFAF